MKYNGTPKWTFIDNRGTLIEVGKKVAYKKATIKVQVIHPKIAGKISTVKCPRNVMVLFEN